MEQAHFNMIEQQVRPWDVLDPKVLELLKTVPRLDYVPTENYKLAYSDCHIPLEHNQVMMEPKVEARLLQALDLKKTDTVLEIGTGCGFLTALLAKASHHVDSVDIYPDFTEAAQQLLTKHNIKNVSFETGDAATGWDNGKCYDAIAITGSLPILPDTYKNSLKRGGRLFVITGQAPIMEAVLIQRRGDGSWLEEPLFETDLPPLVNAVTPSAFSF